MFVTCVRFLALLATGLAAGGALCVLLMDRLLGSSSGAFYTEYKQLSIRALTVPLPLLGVVGTLCAVTDAYFLAKGDDALPLRLTLTAVLLGVAAGVLTRAGHFPINDQIMKWTPETAPGTWEATQARWWAFHVARTASATSSFALLILANVVRGATAP